MIKISGNITNEVLSLPADKRLLLVDHILRSLNLPVSSKINKLWADEAEKRLSELNSNTVKEVDGESVYWKNRKQ